MKWLPADNMISKIYFINKSVMKKNQFYNVEFANVI